MNTSLTVLGTGKGLPSRIVSSAEIDQKLALKIGTTERKSGLAQRYFLADHESADDIQRQAIAQALQSAQISVNDIDCVINASATMRQAIPFNAAHTLRLLDTQRAIPAFDVNMTCLSALRALDLAAALFSQYSTILLVCCDVASVGLDWQDFHSSTIFGDGAVALVLRANGNGIGYSGRILASEFAVYPQGYDFCRIEGGGYRYHPRTDPNYHQRPYFHMQGAKLYQLIAQKFPSFLHDTLAKAHLTLADVDWIVPHQASRGALNHMVSRLKIDKNKLVDIFNTHGNQVAVSIPLAWHYLLTEYPIKSGDKVLLCGTSAGVGVGAVLWQMD